MSRKTLVTLAVAVLGVWGLVSWWSGDKPPATRDQKVKGVESRKEYPLQQREPTILTPDRGPAVSQWPGYGGQPPTYGTPSPPTYGYPYEAAPGYPQALPSAPQVGQYRFRPLTDREKQRMEATYPGYAPPQEGYGSGTPEAYTSAPETQYWQRQGYSFRPWERTQEAREPQVAPYPQREWEPSYDGYSQRAGPGYGQPPWPQAWAPPPAQRYPRLDGDYYGRYSAR